MGDIDQARENFTAYEQLEPEQSAKGRGHVLHLSTLDAKRIKYDEEVDTAGDIIGDLFKPLHEPDLQRLPKTVAPCA